MFDMSPLAQGGLAVPVDCGMPLNALPELPDGALAL